VALRPLSSLGSESKALGNADVRFCQDANSLESESIDVVSSIAVWMTLPSYKACLRYLAEQHRLRCEGRAFIVVTHPCFREELFIVQNPIQERGLLAEWCLLRCGDL